MSMNSRAATPRERAHRNPDPACAPDRFMTMLPVAHGTLWPCLATHWPYPFARHRPRPPLSRHCLWQHSSPLDIAPVVGAPLDVPLPFPLH